MTLIAIALWLFVRANPRQENIAILADGTRIEMLGAAAATVNFTTERGWEKFIRAHIPPQFTGWMKRPFFGAASGPSNSVIVYLRVSRATTNQNGELPWKSFVTEDDMGVRWTMNPPSAADWFDGAESRAHSLILSAFPRRQSWFLLHLLDAKGKPLVSFKVKNPIAGPFPSWTAGHLPQTLSNEAVSLTLKSLARYNGSFGSEVDPYWSVVALQSNWVGVTPREISFSDPTGNWASQPPPHEAIWKLNVRLRRERLADFPATERISFTNIPLPVSTNFIPIDSVREAGGVKIDLWLIAPAGELFLTNNSIRGFSPVVGVVGHELYSVSTYSTGVTSWASEKPFLLMKVSGVQDQDWFFCKVADNLGHLASVDNPAWRSSIGDSRIYVSKLSLPPGATNLNAVFWVSRPQSFSFLVNDSDVEDEQVKKSR